MLFRSGKNWAVDFFLQRGWQIKRRPRIRRRPGSWNPLATVPAECLEERVLLSTITVTSTADSGSGSLRDAVASASAGDTIAFASAINGTPIVLTSGELAISQSLTITGNGTANTIIDAAQNSRIFDITNAAGDVTLDGLTLENGKTTAAGRSSAGGAGGAIFSAATGTLTFSNDIVSGNSTSGTLASGGAVFANGPVTVINSTVSGNSTTGTNAAYGGAIYSTGEVTVLASTLSGNSTSGIHSYGGALFSFGDIQLTNSTVTGNSTLGTGSNGGAIWAGAALTATNSTIALNSAVNGQSGGVYQWTFDPNPAITLKNTIVAQNTDNGTAPDLNIIGGATVTVTHSLIGDNAGTGLAEAPVGSPDGNGNLIGGTTNGLIDPKFGALANNGGPTQTMALLAGSPAIDNGDNNAAISAGLTTDQRGAPYYRIAGAAVDMGAFESQTLDLVVSSTADVLHTTYDPANETLRDALYIANNLAGGGTITFDPSLNGTPIVVTGGQMVISETVTITGNGAANTIINAAHNSRIFSMTSTAGDVTLDSLTLENGKTTASFTSGGAIRDVSAGTLSILNSIVSGNSTTGDNATGGAISDNNGTIAISNTTFSGNSTSGYYGYGGAIGSRYGHVTITDSTFSGNHTTGVQAGGGAIAAAYLTVTDSTLTANYTHADYARGGAIAALHDVTITNSSLTGNSTGGHSATGGAIDAIFGTVTVTGSHLSGNFTTGRAADGGAIFDDYGSVVLYESTLAGNYTTAINARGGAISSGGTSVTVTNSTLSGNSTAGASAIGGAIAAYGAVIVTNSTLSGNSTAGTLAIGGAIYSDKGAVTVTDSTIAQNHVTNAEGGGIYVYSSSAAVTLTNSILAQNTDNGTAPDLDVETGATLVVAFSLIGDNTGTTLTAAPVGTPDGSGNLIGTGGALIDPLLGAVGNHGGPTQTMALLPGSPALAAGAIFNDSSSIPITVDQRGATRFAGGVDIGAFQSATVGSITRKTPSTSPTNASSVTFRVKFNESVLNAGTAFAVNAGSISSVTLASGTTYDVTVTGLAAFNGTLTLSFAPGQTVTDTSGNPLLNTTPTGTNTNTYVLDHVAPSTTSFVRETPSLFATNATTLVFRATFSKAVTAVDPTDFKVHGTTTATVTGVAAVGGSGGTQYDVTVSGGDLATFTGVVGLDLQTGQNITDLAGNPLPTTEPVIEQTYAVDHTPPASFAFAGEYAVATVGSGTLTLASITQISGNLTLHGLSTQSGIVTSTTQFTIGATTATYSDSVITFGSTGPFANQVWTKLDLPADFTNGQGNPTHVVQNGPGVAFVDKFGNTTPGAWLSPTQLSGFGETATIGSGKLSWSDGSAWYEKLALTGTSNGAPTATVVSVPSEFTVFDYNNGHGATVHVIKTGSNNVIFVDGTGQFSLGSFFNLTQATSNAFPNDPATFSNDGSVVTWKDTFVWTKIAPSGQITLTDYTNPNGVTSHVIRNGTSQVVFFDSQGVLSIGNFINATQATSPRYPGDKATFGVNTVTWLLDGTVWTAITTPPPPLVITATNPAGGVSRLGLLTANTLIGLDGPLQGINGVRVNGKIYWSNGDVWAGFNFNALNAFFEMGTGYP